jgi:hypothetical protein
VSVLAMPPAIQRTMTVSAVELRACSFTLAAKDSDGEPAARAPSVAVEAVEIKSRLSMLVFFYCFVVFSELTGTLDALQASREDLLPP